MHYIYALCNPLLPTLDQEYVFYIGLAEVPMSRLGGHLQAGDNMAKSQIIEAIFQETGRSPEMILLAADQDRQEARYLEGDWYLIYARINPNLTSSPKHMSFRRKEDSPMENRSLPKPRHRLQDKVLDFVKANLKTYATYQDLANAASLALSTTVPADYLEGTLELHGMVKNQVLNI